jgi:hypothetical protein
MQVCADARRKLDRYFSSHKINTLKGDYNTINEGSVPPDGRHLKGARVPDSIHIIPSLQTYI